jgi:hypothetical protein
MKKDLQEQQETVRRLEKDIARNLAAIIESETRTTTKMDEMETDLKEEIAETHNNIFEADPAYVHTPAEPLETFKNVRTNTEE